MVTHDKEFRADDDVGDNRMAPREFTRKLLRLVDGRIHLPPQVLLGMTKDCDDIDESQRIGDDEKVQIAFHGVSAAGDRTVVESDSDLFFERCQRAPHHVGHAEGFADETSKFLEDRAIGVRLVVRLTAFDRSEQ